jgi:hypothetical protein
MTARLSRFGAPILAMLCLCTTATPAQTAGPSPLRSDVKSIVPVLESDRSHYSIGQAILLRTSVKNTTANAYYMDLTSFYGGIVNVTVRDASGNVIQPKNTPAFYSKPGAKMNVLIPLAPRETKILNWFYYEGGSGIKQPWVDLASWGYSPLEPGAYTITVDLRTGGRQVIDSAGTTGDNFRTVDSSGKGPTSSVTITVEAKPNPNGYRRVRLPLHS